MLTFCCSVFLIFCCYCRFCFSSFVLICCCIICFCSIFVVVTFDFSLSGLFVFYVVVLVASIVFSLLCGCLIACVLFVFLPKPCHRWRRTAWPIGSFIYFLCLSLSCPTFISLPGRPFVWSLRAVIYVANRRSLLARFPANTLSAKIVVGANPPGVLVDFFLWIDLCHVLHLCFLPFSGGRSFGLTSRRKRRESTFLTQVLPVGFPRTVEVVTIWINLPDV